MDITSILGCIIGVIAVLGAMFFKGISPSVFVNPAALFVIFVGTIATVLNSFPSKNLKDIGKLFKVIFTNDKTLMSEDSLIAEMIDLASIARKEGLLSLESKSSDIDDPFIAKGLRMVVDGMSEDYIRDVLGAELGAMEERHSINASIFSSAGMYAPTLGVLGAVFGLIAAMTHIDDTGEMAHAISAAFIATILGIFTGYVLWNPFAKKLKVKSQHEVFVKSMAIEGLLSIQKGDSPVMVKDKLVSILPQSMQDEFINNSKE